MRKLIGSAVLTAVLLTTPALAAAQRRRPAARPARRAAPERQVSFGVQADYGTDTDLGIGALAVIGLRSLFPKTPLDAHVTFDYFFPSAPAGASLDYWELNGNVAYRIPNPRSSLRPYAGGGLGVAHTSSEVTSGKNTIKASDTHFGLNLLGGATFRTRSSLTPFAQARVSVRNTTQLVLTGGVRF